MSSGNRRSGNRGGGYRRGRSGNRRSGYRRSGNRRSGNRRSGRRSGRGSPMLCHTGFLQPGSQLIPLFQCRTFVHRLERRERRELRVREAPLFLSCTQHIAQRAAPRLRELD